MLEKFKRSIDQGKVFDVLLTDVSKVFGCSPHELIITNESKIQTSKTPNMDNFHVVNYC